MQQVSNVFNGNNLDAERVEYFRAVADYAEMVSRGADLRFLVDSADYVLIYKLAQLVPQLSGSAPVLTESEFQGLAQRVGSDSDEPRSIRVVLVHEIARHCLSQDVIRCVAQYHDEETAQFWHVQTAA